MAGTDSTYIGMPMASGSNGTVGHNTADSKRGNPNGDVVDNTAEHNVMDDGTLHTNLSTGYGANISMQAKAPEIQ
jgi:hypothetical protein